MKRFIVTTGLIVCHSLALAASPKPALAFGGGSPWGWLPAPPGQLARLGDLPLGMAVSRDGRWLAISHGGTGQQSLWLFDATTGNGFPAAVAGPEDGFFHGVAFSPDGKRVFASGGGANAIYIYDLANWWKPARVARFSFDPPQRQRFPAGLALTPDGRTLCVANLLAEELALINVSDSAKPALIDTVRVGSRPYAVAVDKDGLLAYVALWGEPRVAIVDLRGKSLLATVKVGERPTALAFSPDGKNIYVACAGGDSIAIVSTEARKVAATVSLRASTSDLQPSRPTALAVAPDGNRLYVASGMNHDLLVMDTASRKIAGMIPTGWCPTAVAVAPNSGLLYIASARDLGASMSGKDYTSRTDHGLLQILPPPNDDELSLQSDRVANANLLDHRTGRRTITSAVPAAPMPRRIGHPSAIRHVVVILQDRCSFDRVFGDMTTAAADPWLCQFGRDLTGNLHALASSYTVCDNFYLDGPMHAGPAAWFFGGLVMGAPKSWPKSDAPKTTTSTTSSSGSKPSSGHGKKPAMDAAGDGADALRWPTVDTLWGLVGRAGLSRRAYGEFASATLYAGTAFTNWPGGIRAGSDITRADIVQRDIAKLEKLGSLAALTVVSLPNNQTLGTAAAGGSPRAMTCENDLAVGRIIYSLSQTKFWPGTLVLILPDQPAAGFDHLDAHRAPLIVAGPWARRGAVLSRYCDGPAVVRTVEQVLGLPPAGLYDMAAVPLWDAVTPQPARRVYKVVPAAYDIGEKTPARAFGQSECGALGYGNVKPDRALQLARILWTYLRGPNVPPPDPVNQRRTLAPPEPQ